MYQLTKQHLEDPKPGHIWMDIQVLDSGAAEYSGVLMGVGRSFPLTFPVEQVPGGGVGGPYAWWWLF